MYVHIKSCLQKSQSTHNYINDVKVLCLFSWYVYSLIYIYIWKYSQAAKYMYLKLDGCQEKTFEILNLGNLMIHDVFDESMFHMPIERWLVMPLFGTTSACTYELTVFLESHTIKYYIATCSSLCPRPESCPLGDLYSLLEHIWYTHTCTK